MLFLLSLPSLPSWGKALAQNVTGGTGGSGKGGGGGFGGGGFGGGGGINNSGAAGGGGYSGGGGSGWTSGGPNANAPGGGGGSYNAGTNQDNASGVNAGPGQVTITLIAPAPQAAQAPATPASLNINALWDRDLDGVLDTGDNCLETPNPGQLDADGDGFGNACDADVNNDGAVGLDDVAAILAAVGTASPVADLNGDGAVGLDDVSAALGMVGTAAGAEADGCTDTGQCGASAF